MPRDLLEGLETKRPPRDLLEEIPTKTTPQPTSFLPREAEVEKMISERQDSVARLMEEYRTPYDFEKHPVKSILKPAVTVAKTFAIPFQRGESAVAGLGLGLQKGKPMEGLKNIGLGLIGKRQQELGDIIRTTGFGGETFNEPLARGIGLLGLMGLSNIATSGKLVSGANKVEAVAKGKIPKIMGKNYTLQRAEQLNDGLEDLRQGFGSLKQDMLAKVGNITVDAKDLSSKMPPLPKNVLSALDDPIYAIEKLPDGSITPTIKNLDRVKEALADFMTSKSWQEASKKSQQVVKQTYGAITESMKKASPEVGGSLDAYHYFMNDIYKPINKILKSGGEVKEKALRGALKSGAERSIQVAIEKFTQLWDEAPRIVKDIIKFNTRQGFKRGLLGTAKETGRVGILYKGLRSLRGQSGGGF